MHILSHKPHKSIPENFPVHQLSQYKGTD